jgi:hypothetical protein
MQVLASNLLRIRVVLASEFDQIRKAVYFGRNGHSQTPRNGKRHTVMLFVRLNTLNVRHIALHEIMLSKDLGRPVAVVKHGHADVVVREMRRTYAAKPWGQKYWSRNHDIGVITVVPNCNADVDDCDLIRICLHGIGIAAGGTREETRRTGQRQRRKHAAILKI